MSDITQGLGLGADDYLSKPFDYKELVARIKVRLREKATYQSEPKVLTHGDLKLVLDTRDTFFEGKSIDLTQTEFDILRMLIQRIGQVVPRDEIIREVWRDSPEENGGKRRHAEAHHRRAHPRAPQEDPGAHPPHPVRLRRRLQVRALKDVLTNNELG